MSELLRPDFVHDHGKFMLTFIMLWAYFSFSQWLIIWAGNLPEEITWYMRRLNGGWGFVGLFLVIFQFAVPFVLLLSRPFKRDVTRLVWLAVWLMLMRYVDLFWLIEPNFSRTFTVTWADIVVPIRDGWIVAGVLLPQLEFDAAAAGLRLRMPSKYWNRHMSEERKIHHHGHVEPSTNARTSVRAAIFTFMAGLAIAGVLIYFIVDGMYRFLDALLERRISRRRIRWCDSGPNPEHPRYHVRRTSSRFPAAALETNERIELNGFRLQEEQKLHSYGWVDQEAESCTFRSSRRWRCLRSAGCRPRRRRARRPPPAVNMTQQAAAKARSQSEDSGEVVTGKQKKEVRSEKLQAHNSDGCYCCSCWRRRFRAGHERICRLRPTFVRRD